MTLADANIFDFEDNTRGLRPLVLPGLLDGKSVKLKEYLFFNKKKYFIGLLVHRRIIILKH